MYANRHGHHTFSWQKASHRASRTKIKPCKQHDNLNLAKETLAHRISSSQAKQKDLKEFRKQANQQVIERRKKNGSAS